MKRALITGITGQDGSYLAEQLLEDGYQVFGLVRRSSVDGHLTRIQHLFNHYRANQFKLLPGNMRDSDTLRNALEKSRPDEIYNLAAQSDVGVSFQCPDETEEVNYHGLARLLHAVVETHLSLGKEIKIYHASTSEMFGATDHWPQNEETEFSPVSPYAKAKTRAYQDFVVDYRKRYGWHICSGILFNHESPRRGVNFVTRKIVRTLVGIYHGTEEVLELGNLDAVRDWGYAPEYTRAMRLMLAQPKEPWQDFVIATGQRHTVREFVQMTADQLRLGLSWRNQGVKEIALSYHGQVIVRVNPVFYRPVETAPLIGDASLAKRVLGWEPKVMLPELIQIMIAAEMEAVRQ